MEKLTFLITEDHCCHRDDWPSSWAKCDMDSVSYEEFTFEGIDLRYLLKIPYCTMALNIECNSKHIVGISVLEEITGHELARIDNTILDIPSAYSYFPGKRWAFKAHKDDAEKNFCEKIRCCVCAKRLESRWDYAKWKRIHACKGSENWICSSECELRYGSAMWQTENKSKDHEAEMFFSIGKVSKHVGGK